MATEDEVVPNGPGPVVPLIPREPDTHVRRHCCSEIEQLADTARPLPAQVKRRAHTAIGTTCESVVETMDDNHASVGVIEVKEKDTEKVRKHAYYEALLATENMHLHNEPVDVNDVKQKPNWQKWKAAMQEELESLE